MLFLVSFAMRIFPETNVRAQDLISEGSASADVSWRKYEVNAPSGDVFVRMVLIDIDGIREGRISVGPAEGSASGIWGTSTTQATGSRENALACINGPYFATAGDRVYPLGFTVINGALSQLGNLNRPMVGISPNGEFLIEIAHPRAFVTSDAYFEPLWLWGINTLAGADNVTMYDYRWGDSVSVQGGTGVAVEPWGDDSGDGIIEVGPSGAVNDRDDWDGTVVDVRNTGSIEIPEGGYALIFRGRSEGESGRFQVGSKSVTYVYDLPEGWEEMGWIATLGPWFVHDGRLRGFSDETSYGGNITGRASRSCIGTTWNGEIFFAVTTGATLTVQEAAEVLIECNAREAVMCDSGSSGSLWIRGVGTTGSSRTVPISFIVREYSDENADTPPLRVWEGTLR